jgi:hypothetical protein
MLPLGDDGFGALGHGTAIEKLTHPLQASVQPDLRAATRHR